MNKILTEQEQEQDGKLLRGGEEPSETGIQRA